MKRIILSGSTRKRSWITFLFLPGWLFGVAQSPLPVIRAASPVVDILDGDLFRKGYWSVLPDVRPDVYHVERFKGRKTVTFYTDRDSISFEVEKGDTHDFVILLNGKDSAYTRVSAAGPPLMAYRRRDGQKRTSDTISFTLSWKGMIQFRGKINGSDPLDMIFDSGANGVVMSSDAFSKNVKVKIDGTVQGFGLGGASQDGVSHQNTLSIHGLEWKGVSLTVKTEGKPGDDVVIGYNVFDGKVVEIDYENKWLVLHSSLPAKAQNWTAYDLRFRDGLSYIKLLLYNGKKVVDGWFDFDTGSSGTLFLNKEFGAQHALYGTMKSTGSGTLKGSGPAKIEIERIRLPYLVLAGDTLRDVPIDLEAAGTEGGTPFSIVGSDILKRFNLLIDYQNDVVYLSPNSLRNDLYFQEKVDYILWGGTVVLILLLTSLFLYIRKRRRNKKRGEDAFTIS